MFIRCQACLRVEGLFQNLLYYIESNVTQLDNADDMSLSLFNGNIPNWVPWK
jgi:hypothetical protein